MESLAKLISEKIVDVNFVHELRLGFSVSP